MPPHIAADTKGKVDMTLGKTRFWLMVAILLAAVTANPGLLEPAIQPVLQSCVQSEVCALLRQILTEHLTHILIGLTLLVLTLTTARRLPALGASAVWSLLVLALGAMSLGPVLALGDGPFGPDRIPAVTAALLGLMGFLAICPDPGYRGYRVPGVGLVWAVIWAATVASIWASLPVLAETLGRLSPDLAGALDAPLGNGLALYARAQDAVPFPLDRAILAILALGFVAQLMLRIGRRPMIA